MAAAAAVRCRSNHLVCQLRLGLQTPANGRFFPSDVELRQRESQPGVSTADAPLPASGGILGSFNEVFASLMGDGGDLEAGWPGGYSWSETLDADKINVVLNHASSQKELCLVYRSSSESQKKIHLNNLPFE